MKRKYYIFPVLFFFLLIGLGWNYTPVQKTELTPIEKTLKQEYDSIPVLPEACLIKSEVSSKNYNLAWAEGTFSTKLSFEEVRKFYDKELTNKGWRFYKEKKVMTNYNGHNYESKQVYYLKGDYSVSLENPGWFDNEETFGFSVNWGFLK